MTAKAKNNGAAPEGGAALSPSAMAALQGDLRQLTDKQRADHLLAICESLGLNPLTRPFAYIVLNGKLTLYALKDATDQLRTLRGISVFRLEREQTPDSYDVVAYGRDKTGREDSSIGSVSTTGLRGEALANAKMKAETKAKRRLTLSLAGLGWLDETEVGSTPGQLVHVGDDGKIEKGPLEEAIAKAGVAVAEAAEVAPASVTREDPPEPDPVPEDHDEVPGQGEGNGEAPEAKESAAAVAQLDMAGFMGNLREAHILPGAVAPVAKRLFPDAASVGQLTDAERAELWESVRQTHGG